MDCNWVNCMYLLLCFPLLFSISLLSFYDLTNGYESSHSVTAIPQSVTAIVVRIKHHRARLLEVGGAWGAMKRNFEGQRSWIEKALSLGGTKLTSCKDSRRILVFILLFEKGIWEKSSTIEITWLTFLIHGANLLERANSINIIRRSPKYLSCLSKYGSMPPCFPKWKTRWWWNFRCLSFICAWVSRIEWDKLSPPLFNRTL